MSDVPQIDGEDGKVRPLAAPSSAFLQPDARSLGFAHLLGMQIVKSADGVGQVRIAVDHRLMHPQQAVHGGVIFTLADTAMSMALRSVLPPGTPFGTIEAKINYLRPVPDGDLLAEGLIVHQGGSTAVMEATIYNLLADEQQVVAKALGTFYIKRAKETNP